MKHKCEVCSLVISTKQSLNIHLKEEHTLDPLVKWSGGKKDEIKNFIDFIPKKFETYIEPFVGGGSLFFHLRPEKAVINDIHPELISFYNCIKNGYSKDIYEFMKANPNEEKTYYKIRSEDDEDESEISKACRFYYLRKTCFRGMMRYNKKGKFNIPFGKYKTINFEALLNTKYTDVLKNTQIFNKDFEYIFENFNSKNNFMFLDPPYDSPFTDYGYCNFDREKHRILADLFKKTSIKCMIILGKTEFILELYKGYIKGSYYKKYRFKIHSNRVGEEIDNEHLIITNY